MFKNGKLKKSFYLVIMNNVFHNGVKPITPSRIFDLKGSTFKRRTSDEKLKLKAAGKDLNFLDMIKNAEIKISIGSDRLETLLDTIDKDSKFLADNNIIDYRFKIFLFN